MEPWPLKNPSVLWWVSVGLRLVAKPDAGRLLTGKPHERSMLNLPPGYSLPTSCFISSPFHSLSALPPLHSTPVLVYLLQGPSDIHLHVKEDSSFPPVHQLLCTLHFTDALGQPNAYSTTTSFTKDWAVNLCWVILVNFWPLPCMKSCCIPAYSRRSNAGGLEAHPQGSQNPKLRNNCPLR